MTKIKKFKMELLKKYLTDNSPSKSCQWIVDYGDKKYTYLTNALIALNEKFFDKYEISKYSECPHIVNAKEGSKFNVMAHSYYDEYYTCGISEGYNPLNKIIGELKDFYIIQRNDIYYPVEKRYYDFLTKNGFYIFAYGRERDYIKEIKESKTSSRKYYSSNYYAIFHKTRSNPEYYMVQEDLPLPDGLFVSSNTQKLTVEELDEFVDSYLANEPYEFHENYLKQQCLLSVTNTKIANLYMEKVVNKKEEFGNFMFEQLVDKMNKEEVTEFYRKNN